jgi:protein ImuB
VFASIHAPGNLPILLDCARRFSPLIEITSPDTVTFDIRGLGRVYGEPQKIAREIERVIGMPAHIAIAANPDTAVCAARGIAGTRVISPGEEGRALSALSLHLLGCPPAMGELFDLWGIRTFGQFAALPAAGVAARLGEEGVYWQCVARGSARRQLRLMEEKVDYSREMELENPIPLLEPLFFLLARFLFELCTELTARSLATNEIRLRLTLEKEAEHLVTLRLPVPMADQKTLLKLLDLELNGRPPGAAIRKIQLALEPVKPRIVQEDFFAPAYPSPEKIELTIARIRHFTGAENIGSPRVLDTHRPDSFVMGPLADARGSVRNMRGAVSEVRIAFRRFRPPQKAHVITEKQPVHITSAVARGAVGIAKGPWFTSGNWWRTDTWNREEWDIALRSGALYRIFRDLRTEAWFVEGNYD